MPYLQTDIARIRSKNQYCHNPTRAYTLACERKMFIFENLNVRYFWVLRLLFNQSNKMQLWVSTWSIRTLYLQTLLYKQNAMCRLLQGTCLPPPKIRITWNRDTYQPGFGTAESLEQPKLGYVIIWTGLYLRGKQDEPTFPAEIKI